MEKDFDGWNFNKKYIEKNAQGKFCREREFWWCFLGLNIGSEEDGKTKQFKRPVVIVKTIGKICLIVPLTTSKRPHPFRISIGIIGDREAVVIVSQLRLIDTKRLSHKITILDKTTFETIRKSTRNMF